MRQQVAAFLAARAGAAAAPVPSPDPAGQPVATFVCEDDVKDAMKTGRKIVVGERTIITPSARDLAGAHKVFVPSGWPRP
jgi:hypothetical protein